MYAYFRSAPTTLRGQVESATVFVTAGVDGAREQLLSAYRLYVNGKVVGVGQYINLFFPPRICSRTLVYVTPTSHSSLGAAACYRLVMLNTRALY